MRPTKKNPGVTATHLLMLHFPPPVFPSFTFPPRVPTSPPNWPPPCSKSSSKRHRDERSPAMPTRPRRGGHAGRLRQRLHCRVSLRPATRATSETSTGLRQKRHKPVHRSYPVY